MALINCPECGKQVSDKSAICIHCGYPIAEHQQTKENNKTNTIQDESTSLLEKGRHCYESKHFEDALRYFYQASELGNAEAKCYLGHCYFQGCGVQQDIACAIDWYRQSAQSGCHQAMNNLGILHLNGQGVPRDYDKGIAYLHKASELGNKDASGNLAIIYEQGIGTAKDFAKACKMYQLAISQGETSAVLKHKLALLYMNGSGTDVDFEKAEALLLDAISQGLPAAQSTYEELRVRKDPPRRTFSIAGREVSFSNDLVTYNNLRNQFVNQSMVLEKEFTNFYKSRKHTFDGLFEEEIPTVVYKIIDALHYGVSVLMEYGIDDIDDNELGKMVAGNEGVRDALEPIYQKAQEIEDLAISMGEYRAVQRAGRGYWEGGGFGIGGAIKGALTAGALNMGTNMFRGIGDSLTNASDRAKISKLKHELANNPAIEECLQETIHHYCMKTFYAVRDILTDKGKLPFLRFDTKSALARAKNYVAKYYSNNELYDTTIDVLCESIHDSPYTAQLYFELYRIYKGDKQPIHQLASYFGNRRKYKNLLIAFDTETVNEISKMEENSTEKIDIKIQKYRALLKDDPYLDLSDNIGKLKEKRRVIEAHEKKINEAHSISNTIRERRKAFLDYLNSGLEEVVWEAAYHNDLCALYELKVFYYHQTQAASGNRSRAVQAMPVIIRKLGSADSDVGIFMQRDKKWRTNDLVARYLYVFLIYTVLEQISWLFRSGAEDSEKTECYRQMTDLATKNNIMAIGDLGYMKCTFFSMSTASAKAEGIKMLKDAALQLEPFALLHLGQGYKDGKWGLTKDATLAEYYLTLAAAYDLQEAAAAQEKMAAKPAAPADSSSGCFITSAVCRSFNKPDDCYELTAFRNFRDSWLSKQPDGSALIQEYYLVAPQIVAEIDSRDNASMIYQGIWEEYLQQCLSHIENEEFAECKALYCEMVTTLKQKYLTIRE